MSVSAYLRSKDVTPEELKTNFKIVKAFQIDANESSNKRHNCGALVNLERLSVGQCLTSHYCRFCEAIIMIYPQNLNNSLFYAEVYKEP